VSGPRVIALTTEGYPRGEHTLAPTKPGDQLTTLGHNTIRGAAGAAILNAELLVAKGYLGAPRAR